MIENVLYQKLQGKVLHYYITLKFKYSFFYWPKPPKNIFNNEVLRIPIIIFIFIFRNVYFILLTTRWLNMVGSYSIIMVICSIVHNRWKIITRPVYIDNGFLESSCCKKLTLIMYEVIIVNVLCYDEYELT